MRPPRRRSSISDLFSLRVLSRISSWPLISHRGICRMQPCTSVVTCISSVRSRHSMSHEHAVTTPLSSVSCTDVSPIKKTPRWTSAINNQATNQVQMDCPLSMCWNR
ncbi:hypothetical protein ACQJBY_069496 [Aegilops geniculata]